MSSANDDGLKEEKQDLETSQNEKNVEVIYDNSYNHTEKMIKERDGNNIS